LYDVNKKAFFITDYQCFGHIMRHPEKHEMLHLIIEGKITSRKGPGRRRTSSVHPQFSFSESLSTE